jgi:DNA-binding CsgD family transcriptional regulator
LLTHRQWEIVEQLVDLDPVESYPRRGAGCVAELVGSPGFRLRLGDAQVVSDPPPSGEPTLRLALVVGDEELGELYLHGLIGDEGRHAAERGSRIFAKGLRHARRLDEKHGQRSAEDVQAMLERTPLTPRERDVVGRLLSGATTRQIATSTGLTVATVNTYLKRIFAKLGVHSRVELVARVTGTRGVIPSDGAETSTA